MKKTLLSLFVLAAMTASAQITVDSNYYFAQDWTTTDVPTTHPIWGSGYDGKIYVKETTYTNGGTGQMHCYEWDADANAVKHSIVEGLVTAGSSFNFDGAGNALVVSNAYAATTLKVVLWNSKTNEISEEIDLTEGIKSLGATVARMDYMGRGAGDMFSAEGASFFFGFNGVQEIVKCHIANGKFDVEMSSLIAGPAANNTQMVIQPLTTDPESDAAAYRHRSNKDFYYHNGSKWVAYTRVGTVNASAGGDVVTLNGTLYTLEPAGTNYRDGFQIVNRDNNTVVATVPETLTANTTGNVLAVHFQKIDETKAHVYQYHPKAYVAKYTFAVPGDQLTAIQEVGVDANAPVEYYNLQGVKVENPTNGIFIMKQGAKTTKIVR